LPWFVIDDECPLAVCVDDEPWDRTAGENGYPGGNTNGNIGGRLHLRKKKKDLKIYSFIKE
jgi:hypothetical protein